jgi:oxygen-independent coproporphyrinogen-3 oxidase
LKEAISFETGHLSLYQLTIEPATPFAALHRTGALKTPDEDTAAALYEVTQELTESAGIPAYEVSNHARAGEEARHNLLYWRYGSYAGIGPGAHGRLHANGAVIATSNEKLPERWRERVVGLGSGIVEQVVLLRKEIARENLLMSLRLCEGLDINAFETRWDVKVDRAKLAGLDEEGLVTSKNGIFAATPRGRLVLNALIAALAD